MDRLTSLTVFGRVVEDGGFSAAARHLNMSVTMVSNHIQSLEDRLGVRLLNRTTRKVSLTDIGRAYYERSRQILIELDDADLIASAEQAAPRGVLKLYTSMIMVRYLAPMVEEFLAAYPAASVDLTVGERMVDLVEEGIDLAIRAVQPIGSTTLVVRRLAAWRHVLCCAPAYLETHAAPEHPSDLAGHNCLRFAHYPFGNDWRFEGPDGKPVSVTVGGRLVTNSAEMIRLLTLAGQGLVLAPTFVTADDIAAGRLVALMPNYRPPEFSINAIYPDRHHLPAKTRAFIDLLAARFSAHRKWMNPEAPLTG
jgi:DNA-binding transcriptional LysR family regulator